MRRIGRYPLSDAGLVGLSVRMLVERWISLLAPSAVAAVPLTVIFGVLLVLMSPGRFHVMGRDLELTGSPDGTLAIAVGCWLVLVLASSAWVLAAQVVLVCGALDDRPIRVRAALRAAVRSVPAVSLLLVLVIVVVLGVVIGAVVVADLVLDGLVWLPLVVLGLFGWWLIAQLWLAVPAVVLDGVGPFGGLRTAHRVTRRRPFPYARSLLLLVAGILVGIGWLSGLALGPVEDAAGVADGTFTVLPGTILSPLWACLLTVLLENRRPPGLEDLPRGKVVLDDDAAARPLCPRPLHARVTLAVVAALILPGLVLNGLAAWNPTDLPTTASFTSQARANSVEVHPLGHGRTATVLHREGGFEIAFCERDQCPPGQHYDYPLDLAKYSVTSTPLPDGTVAVTAWINTAEGTSWDLRLFHCDQDGCPTAARPSTSPTLRHYDGKPYLLTQDVTASPDGTLVVAATTRGTEKERASESDFFPTAHLHLIRCADPSCAGPTSTPIAAGFESDFSQLRGPVWGVALTADERPVLIGAHRIDGQLVTVVCDTARCRHPAIRKTPQPKANSDSVAFSSLSHTDVTVDGTDRPVATYQADGRSHFFGCRDRQCTRTMLHPLPKDSHVLGVGTAPEGTPDIALVDDDFDRATVDSCQDSHCTNRRTLASFGVSQNSVSTWDREFHRDKDSWILIRTNRVDSDQDEGRVTRYDVTTIPTHPAG